MSWSDWTDLLVLGLWMNGLAGSLLFLIWRGLARLLGEKLDIQASYKILHLVVLFFVCPIFGILEIFEAVKYCYGNSVVNPLRGGMHEVWVFFLLLWLTGILLLTIQSMRNGRKIRNLIRKGSMSANLRWQRSVEEARKHLGCRSRILCRERYGDSTPFVCGICQATIYFPVGDFNREQMYVMAVHEVNHVKSRDLFWKQLVEVVRILYWPLAPVWFLRKAVDDWSEYCCDFLSCKALGNYREYVDVLTDMIFQRVQWYRPAWLSTFCNNRSELSLRVRSLVNQKKLDPFRMQCALAVVILFCLLGGSGVMAATRTISMRYRTDYWGDLVKVDDPVKENPQPLSHGEVFYAGISDLGLDRIPEDHWVDGKVDGYDIAMDSGGMFFELVLAPGEKVISYPLDNSQAEDIYISCSLEEESGDYIMGIADAQGICQYIFAGGTMDEGNTFPCQEAGPYRFFLINCGQEEMSVFGMTCIAESEE